MAGIYELTDTWNSGGTTFSAVKMNVTDSASASGSKLIDLQVGAAEKFAVTKTGLTRTAGAVNITDATATALTVGPNGTTNPALAVDASAATAATGLKVTAAAEASGAALSVVSSGTNENLTIDAKGSGTVTINGTATGAIALSRNTAVTGTLAASGNFAINTDKFTVAAASGNTAIAGDTTIGGSLSVADELTIDAGENEDGPVVITGEIATAGTDAGAAGHTGGAVASHVLIISVGGTPYYVPLCAINTTT